MASHAIAPDAGMNVRCICGAEYSLATNAAKHVERENAADAFLLLGDAAAELNISAADLRKAATRARLDTGALYELDEWQRAAVKAGFLHPGRGMQAQLNVKSADELARLVRYTGGEYPVSGDLSRVTFARWTEFSLPSVWTRRGVRA